MSYRTATEIAASLDLTKRAVQRRAKNERWSHIEITDRGGKIPLYRVRLLPEDVTASLDSKANDVVRPIRVRTKCKCVRRIVVAIVVTSIIAATLLLKI